MPSLLNEITKPFSAIVTQVPAVGQLVLIAIFVALLTASFLAPWVIRRLRQSKIEQIHRDAQEVHKLA